MHFWVFLPCNESRFRRLTQYVTNQSRKLDFTKKTAAYMLKYSMIDIKKIICPINLYRYSTHVRKLIKLDKNQGFLKINHLFFGHDTGTFNLLKGLCFLTLEFYFIFYLPMNTGLPVPVTIITKRIFREKTLVFNFVYCYLVTHVTCYSYQLHAS